MSCEIILTIVIVKDKSDIWRYLLVIWNWKNKLETSTVRGMHGSSTNKFKWNWCQSHILKIE